MEEIAARDEPNRSQTNSLDICNMLDVLARGERDVLELRIVHGLGFRDVGAALGISEEAAKKRAQRALRRLRATVCDSESSLSKSSAIF